MELKYSEKFSVLYHDIFDYPLTKEEFKKWTPKIFKKSKKEINVLFKNNLHFIKGRSGVVKKRLQNEKYSKSKLKIAKKASQILSFIPTIKFVGITGALAMSNAGKQSDIDLLIITKNNTLWLTRVCSYLLIRIFGFKIRSPRNKSEKDMLCLNMWLDENDLVWGKKDRNIYTAHEVLQVVPLVNKDKTYEEFINRNNWATSFWPNVVSVRETKKTKNNKTNIILSAVNSLLFAVQYLYMKPKMTREVVTKTRAIFHPNDWGKIVISKLTT